MTRVCTRKKTFFQRVDSKTRTYPWRIRKKRTAAWRGGVRQVWVQTAMFAQATCLLRAFLEIEDTSPERLLRNTNQENPTRTYGETKPAFEQQLNRKTEKHIIYGC